MCTAWVQTNNTVGEYLRDQGVKIVIFVIPSTVRIVGKDSNDSSISSLLLSGCPALEDRCQTVVNLKNENKYSIPGPNFQICR